MFSTLIATIAVSQSLATAKVDDVARTMECVLTGNENGREMKLELKFVRVQ